MKKTTLLLLFLALWGGNAFSQVLGGGTSSILNNNWGIGFNAGTNYAFGRTFLYSENYGISNEITPDKYRQAAISPSYSIDFWRNSNSEPWFWGTIMTFSYGELKYYATFESMETDLRDKEQYFNIYGFAYAGYWINDKLSASLGVGTDFLGILTFENSLGFLARVHYSISDHFYAAARMIAGIPLSDGWSSLNDYAQTGLYVSDKHMIITNLSLGIGFSF